MIRHLLFTSLLLIGCGKPSDQSNPMDQYRCVGVDPGIIWAVAYGSAYTNPNNHGISEAVTLANKAVAYWESACTR